MPTPPEQPVKIADQRRESDQLPERVAVRVRPLQHPLASSSAVLPGQCAGLLDQVFVFLAEATLVRVEGVVERPEQAGFKDARDDQPTLDVEEVFLALAQAMHVAEPTHHRNRPSNELGQSWKAILLCVVIPRRRRFLASGRRFQDRRSRSRATRPQERP